MTKLNSKIVREFLSGASALTKTTQRLSAHLQQVLGTAPTYELAVEIRKQFYTLAEEANYTPEAARKYWSRLLKIAGITPATKTGKARVSTNKRASAVQHNADLVKWMRETAAAVAKGDAPALIVGMLYDVKNESAE